MSFGISDKQVKEFYQKEYDEKHTPISVIALAFFRDQEKGTVSIEQEELTAMRAILKQYPLTKESDDIFLSLLDEFEFEAKCKTATK